MIQTANVEYGVRQVSCDSDIVISYSQLLKQRVAACTPEPSNSRSPKPTSKSQFSTRVPTSACRNIPGQARFRPLY